MTVTFRRDGRYDEQALAQLNWLLRDWRTDEPIKMDPRLFDILWELYREVGSREPVNIISAYRSPDTNGMLRRRSSGVSEHSQHMLGKAMDIRLPDVDTAACVLPPCASNMAAWGITVRALSCISIRATCAPGRA